MSSWDFKNIGASTTNDNRKMVEAIFEYIGYAKYPACSEDGEECLFHDPDVFCCWRSDYEKESGHLEGGFSTFDEVDLLNLLNALFPNTSIFVHSASGNNTSDTWENHYEIYNTENMTYYAKDKYTDYGGYGPNGTKTWKKRFILKAPELKYVEKLIGLSKAYNNSNLTVLLLDLSKKLNDGLLKYEDYDESNDNREIDKEYDVFDDMEYCLDEGNYGYEDDEYEDDEYEDDDIFIIENGELLKYNGDLCHVIIPQEVKTIGPEAFDGDDDENEGICNLEKITIPATVVNIDTSFINNCGCLKWIEVEAGNTSYTSEAGILYSKDKTILIKCPANTDETITIPDSVVEIGEYAFSHCRELDSVIIPQGVTRIGHRAFFGCESLKSIIIPNSVTTIADQAFCFCDDLKSLELPTSVTSIGYSAFDDDISLVTPVGSYAEKYAKEYSFHFRN